MDARLIGESLATVLDRLADDVRARAAETERRLEKEMAERSDALYAELPRQRREVTAGRMDAGELRMGKAAEPESPASYRRGTTCVGQKGVILPNPGSPGRLSQHGNKSVRAGKAHTHLSLVVDNG